MSDSVFCSLCFKFPAQLLRECQCFYCISCRDSHKAQCPCGGGGRFVGIPETVALLVKSPLSSNFAIFLQLSQDMQKKSLEFLAEIIDSIAMYYALKENIMNQKIIKVYEKLYKAQTELDSWKNRGFEGNFMSNAWNNNLTPSNRMKLNFDLAPFEMFLKKQ